MKSDNTILISVHVPKCAGTSFGVWLNEVYGEEYIYPEDYRNGPTYVTSVMNIDPCGFLAKYRDGYPFLAGKKAVHGHFWVKKYQYLQNAIRITFLREPVERAISNYYFWLKFPRIGDPVHDYFLDNNLSFEQFCKLPLMQYIYTKVFFRDVDMSVFDFIGQHNALKEDMLRLSKMLGVDDVKLPFVNANPSGSYNEKVQEIMGNKALVNKVQDILSDDIKFYEKYAGK